VYIPLSKAVAQAHRRLFPDEPRREPKTLQTIALALTMLLPIYRRDTESQLTELELEAGRFAATSMDDLVVSQIRFEAALEMLQVGSLDVARVSLTLRQSPRAFSVRR
jgi:hypothetical protein